MLHSSDKPQIDDRRCLILAGRNAPLSIEIIPFLILLSAALPDRDSSSIPVPATSCDESRLILVLPAKASHSFVDSVTMAILNLSATTRGRPTESPLIRALNLKSFIFDRADGIKYRVKQRSAERTQIATQINAGIAQA